ncbi:MAG: hypothetical protein ACRENE_08015, partial [Polyangiaceae bacterium]
MRTLRVWVLFGVAACGSAGNAGYPIDVGGDDAGGLHIAARDASVTGLDAYVEKGQIAVSIFTVGCSGSCATVQAVGTGGEPPYSFRWENGSTNPVREVCPAADSSYSVTVTDSPSTGEVSHPSGTAHASVTADVLGCSDAGPGDAATGYTDCDDLAAGFSPSGTNPGKAWSYGWTRAVGTAFQLYPTFVAQDLDAGAYSTNAFPSIAQWYDPANGVVGQTGPVPDIQYNPLGVPVYPGSGNLSGNSWVVGAGQVVMAPINSGTASSVARWTAPVAGTYGVFATFASTGTSGFTHTSELHVQRDGADLPAGAGNITATTTSFA